jgi:predicted dehydrogenase
MVALSDPDQQHRKAMKTQAGLPKDIPEFDAWQDMLREIPDLNGVVICTPNFLHADQAVACLERGLPIALEKPLATTQKDCERIIAAEASNGGRVLLGFVLRSTPFYSKIHEVISNGVIGKVVSIQADELPGRGVTSIMNRSPWRRYVTTSGGSMLEKSCHDMDVLNWMMGCKPSALTSYGSSLIFTPKATLPMTCDDCKEASTCLYYKTPSFSAHEDRGEQVLHQFIREDNRCIHNIDKDIADVQGMCIEYESGAVANFMLTFNCSGPRAGRNFHAVGTKGRVWGNLGEAKVFVHENLSGETVGYDARGDGSGHAGGDRLHALLLRQMMQDPDFRPEQDAKAGYLSAVMCFAADLSRSRRQTVRFEYGRSGLVTLR